MPLNSLKPSATVTSIIRDHLAEMASLGRFRTRALRETAPAQMSLSAPHPVYNLGLSDIKGPTSLSKAKHTTWRYLILRDKTPIAAAEAVAGSGGAEARFSHTNEGPFVAATADAIEAAEKLPEVEAGRYTLNVLRVPALYVVALWLKSGTKNGPGDLLIPLDPAPAGLTAGARMTPEAFVTALSALKASRGASSGASS